MNRKNGSSHTENGKYNLGVISTVPAPADGVTLRALWQVDEDAAYQVERRSGAPTWILIRTLAGTGGLVTAAGTAYPLEADSVLLIDNRQVRRYGTAASHWRFNWFEFTAARPGLPPECPLIPAADGFEEEAVNRMAALLRAQNRERAAAASALLGWLLRWYGAESGHGTAGMSRDRRIDAAVAMMSARLDVPLQIRHLARRLGMCDRAFRTLFLRETGVSPKRYYDRLRLHYAAEMLASGEYGVEQVALRLGFSSPFHFSAAFKRFFGVAPSHYRAAEAGE